MDLHQMNGEKWSELDRLNRQHLDALNATIIKQANTIGRLLELLGGVTNCLNWHANIKGNCVGMDQYWIDEARKAIANATP